MYLPPFRNAGSTRLSKQVPLMSSPQSTKSFGPTLLRQVSSALGPDQDLRISRPFRKLHTRNKTSSPWDQSRGTSLITRMVLPLPQREKEKRHIRRALPPGQVKPESFGGAAHLRTLCRPRRLDEPCDVFVHRQRRYVHTRLTTLCGQTGAKATTLEW